MERHPSGMGQIIMKPGRDLDLLVAQIMGWTWDEFSAWSPNDSRYAVREPDPLDWLPHYSTDIADAWDVVEHISLIGGVCKAETPFWIAWIVSVDDQFVKGLSAPHAICLAALESMNPKPNPHPG
jgi:hypothetical protein